MLPNKSKGCCDAPAGQAEVGSELDFGFEPELRFPRGVLHMDVHPSLFPRKEVEPISSTAEDGRTHETIIPNPPSRALGRLNAAGQPRGPQGRVGCTVLFEARRKTGNAAAIFSNSASAASLFTGTWGRAPGARCR